MCGIAGIFAHGQAAPPVDRRELQSIRDQMAARGPDGKGEWYADDNRVGLGHRRLSIIDLSDRAAQPMTSADGRLVVTFNGEIYNYRQLRRSLEERGRVFRTESDTEVLLHLYDEAGTAMFGQLRGMYAFALWDGRRQSLLLGRDPYGIKPLYVADDGGTLRFASQVKALLASPKVSRVAEPAGQAGFFLFGCIPEPYTLYREIRAVPAGCFQWADAAGLQPPVPYFSIAGTWAAGEHSSALAPDEFQAAVRASVLDSVRAHMVADVPVGAFLSAGIDSGALVALMAEVASAGGSSAAPTAITLAFDEYQGTHDDEAPLAESVARHYGVAHTVRRVSEQEFRDDLPKLLDAMDQPTIDGINTWFVSKAAKEAGLKVAISGLGGDELFGGYPSFVDMPKWLRLLWLPSRIPGLGSVMEKMQDVFAPLIPQVNPKMWGMARYGGTYAGTYLLRRGLFMPKDLPDLMGKELAEEGLKRLQPLGLIQRQLTGGAAEGENRPSTDLPASAYGRIATLEATLYMRNQLLRDADWASMAHSLEIRTPLVDSVLLEQLAGPLVTGDPGKGKQLLAESPLNPLPAAIAKREKSGFTTPIAGWQQHGNDLKSWRDKNGLRAQNCPWARRWAYVIDNRWCIR